MKIEHEHQETVTKKTVMRFCDDCHTPIDWHLQCSVAKCEICGADLCDTHVAHENSTGGDYREVYCKTCWDIGKPFRKKIDILENREYQLGKDWKEAGKAARKKFMEEGGYWIIPKQCRKCQWLDRFKDTKEPLCNYGVNEGFGHPLAGKTEVIATCRHNKAPKKTKGVVNEGEQ